MKLCPRKMIIRDARVPEDRYPDDDFVSSPVRLNNNFVGIQEIHNNAGVAVPIKLLAIEEQMECTEPCGEGRQYYSGTVCELMPNELAHLYVFTEESVNPAEHCIIAFVEATKIGMYTDLLNILYHTAQWLNIENEHPHFYIYYFGKQPAFENNLDDAKRHITRSLRIKIKNYEEGETFCQTSRVRADTANVTVYNSKPYRFNVS